MTNVLEKINNRVHLAKADLRLKLSLVSCQHNYDVIGKNENHTQSLIDNQVFIIITSLVRTKIPLGMIYR